MTGVGRDFRFAWRAVLSQPALAAPVVVLMALGIGASTAAFSAVNGILWIRHPYPDADRLVVPVSVSTCRSLARSNVTYADYRDWSAMQDVFDHVAVFGTGQVDLAGTGDPERIDVARVSKEYFATLGLQPTLGRSFEKEDHLPGAPEVAETSRWARSENRSGNLTSIQPREIHLAPGM